jgi:hypothetical protein
MARRPFLSKETKKERHPLADWKQTEENKEKSKFQYFVPRRYKNLEHKLKNIIFDPNLRAITGPPKMVIP